MLSQFYLKYTLFKSKLQVYSASYTQTGLLKILHKSLPCLKNQNTLKLYSQKHSGGWGDAQLSFQFSSVAQSCPTLWNPHGLQHSRLLCPSPTPRAYSNSCLLVSDAIQPCHPLASSSPAAFNLCQHQSLFKQDSSSHQGAKILEFQVQHLSFQ